MPYDQLLLCTGEQFGVAVPTGADVEKLLTTREALQAGVPQVLTNIDPRTNITRFWTNITRFWTGIVIWNYPSFY